MDKEKQYKFPDLDICRKYIAEAEKIESMPEEKTDIVSFDFNENTLKELDMIAKTWNVSTERVIQAMLIALVKENEE